jgi:hypothetical protein
MDPGQEIDTDPLQTPTPQIIQAAPYPNNRVKKPLELVKAGKRALPATESAQDSQKRTKIASEATLKLVKDALKLLESVAKKDSFFRTGVSAIQQLLRDREDPRKVTQDLRLQSIEKKLDIVLQIAQNQQTPQTQPTKAL